MSQVVPPQGEGPSESVTSSDLPAQFEFSAEQNTTVGELATKMRFVGLFLIIGGVLECLMVLKGDLGGLIGGLVEIVLGVWTRRAADSFQKIVDTKGRDISHLMDALVDLLKMYRLQYTLLVIALVLLAVAVPVLIILALSR
jgi:hypothetical protein